MSPPEEYVTLMDQFVSSNKNGVKIDGADKVDAACFSMVAHMKKYPVEVRILPKKQVLLVRTDR